MKKLPIVLSLAVFELLFVGPTVEAANRDWNLQMVNSLELDSVGTCPGQVVAVLDTGIWPKSPGLSGATILPSRDFVNEDDIPRDDNGHGTHIASLVHRLCPDCPILAVKILDRHGLGDAQSLARGIRWAVEHGASVINLSVGFDSGYEPGVELEEAVRFALQSGVVLVAAVGNEGRIGPSYPAAYPGVIAVAAVDFDGARPAYSNLNPAVSVAAPGGDDRDRDGDGIPESVLGQGLTLHGVGPEPWLYSGTSQATAHVSALAARLVACGVAPEEVQPLMEATANNSGVGFNIGTGMGVVDFWTALTTASAGLRPEGWRRRYRIERHDSVRGVEVVVLDQSGPVPGAFIFGHWRSGGRAIVSGITDAEGKLLVDPPNTRLAHHLIIDRIALNATPLAKMASRETDRPYVGVLARPLSRYVPRRRP